MFQRLSKTLILNSLVSLEVFETEKRNHCELSFQGLVMQTGRQFYFLLAYIISTVSLRPVFAEKNSGEFHIEVTIDGISPKFVKTEKPEKSKKNDEKRSGAFPPRMNRDSGELSLRSTSNDETFSNHRVPQIGGFRKPPTGQQGWFFKRDQHVSQLAKPRAGESLGRRTFYTRDFKPVFSHEDNREIQEKAYENLPDYYPRPYIPGLKPKGYDFSSSYEPILSNPQDPISEQIEQKDREIESEESYGMQKQ